MYPTCTAIPNSRAGSQSPLLLGSQTCGLVSPSTLSVEERLNCLKIGQASQSAVWLGEYTGDEPLSIPAELLDPEVDADGTEETLEGEGTSLSGDTLVLGRERVTSSWASESTFSQLVGKGLEPVTLSHESHGNRGRVHTEACVSHSLCIGGNGGMRNLTRDRSSSATP